MSAPARLAAFAATLAVLFGGGALAGGAVDPDRGTPSRPHAEAAGAHGGGERASHPVRGLAVAEDGLRLVVEDPELRRGRTERLRFHIVDDAGATVRDFDIAHERRMHLIVARRDLATFQHLHPEQQADGGWAVGVALGEAGAYRLLADFSHGGEPVTLASDLRVDGAADLRPLPAPSATATDGDLTARLDASRTRPGEKAELRFTVARDGRTVKTQPYLGAGGHLVALREGDLAFLHVHPTEHGAGAAIGFAATFPTAGRYRLFLQVRQAGRVRTFAFTHEAGR